MLGRGCDSGLEMPKQNWSLADERCSVNVAFLLRGVPSTSLVLQSLLGLGCLGAGPGSRPRVVDAVVVLSLVNTSTERLSKLDFIPILSTQVFYHPLFTGLDTTFESKHSRQCASACVRP